MYDGVDYLLEDIFDLLKFIADIFSGRSMTYQASRPQSQSGACYSRTTTAHRHPHTVFQAR